MSVEKKGINFWVGLAVVPIWACLSMREVQAAQITYDFVTAPAFVNRSPGPDFLWGTADDTFPASTNSSGAASFTFNNNGLVSFFTGTFTVDGTGPGVHAFTSFNVTPDVGLPVTLDAGHVSQQTFTDLQHFTSDIFFTDGTNHVEAVGLAGFAIFNAPGFNDPSVFGMPGLTTDFNFIVAQLPSTWTQLNIELLTGGGVDILAADFTTDSAALAVPEPEIYAMMGIGLALMGFVARRTKLQITAA